MTRVLIKGMVELASGWGVLRMGTVGFGGVVIAARKGSLATSDTCTIISSGAPMRRGRSTNGLMASLRWKIGGARRLPGCKRGGGDTSTGEVGMIVDYWIL
jgi:hypothetical protein